MPQSLPAADIKDRREGLVPDDLGLTRHLDQGGADVIGLMMGLGQHARAAGDRAAGLPGLGEARLHRVIAGLVDERAD